MGRQCRFINVDDAHRRIRQELARLNLLKGVEGHAAQVLQRPRIGGAHKERAHQNQKRHDKGRALRVLTAEQPVHAHLMTPLRVRTLGTGARQAKWHHLRFPNLDRQGRRGLLWGLGVARCLRLTAGVLPEPGMIAFVLKH